ncbi:MAG: Phosphate acetyltransferase [Firmicutes bacterium ADurb.Bin080]|jgi:phosphate acetyltransferase|nr:phosphate acetyltransferase [Clostridiales bacterium]OQC12674.1 MAG: Phosphate acetyltransferase [Firmicutes bacterium ADurb.Bin080]
MSKLMDRIISKANELHKHIVLGEGEEIRVIHAAEIINKMKMAKITLLGNKTKILSLAEENSLVGVDIVDPDNSPDSERYANLLYELRKEKGMTIEKARALTKDSLYYGCLMIKSGDADGMVAGAIHATSDVLRPALQIIKAKEGLKTVSSFFLMSLPEGSVYGQEGVMIFSDCGVLPDPTADQLVDIAISAAESARRIAGIKDPKVAMLSFSTKGSASHPLVDKVLVATSKLKSMPLDFAVDGELQLDAAIVPSVARLKAPGSTVAGYANVLVFPDLQSGNIGYKLAQRLGNAEAIGPICQGLASPVNDLSRGCNVTDIVGAVAITALQLGE